MKHIIIKVRRKERETGIQLKKINYVIRVKYGLRQQSFIWKE